jgi:hypothetical protein
MKLTDSTRRLLTASTIAMGLVVTAASMPTDSPREGALRWARALPEATRIAYAEAGRLQELPLVYRKAVFATLPSAEHRAQAWRNVFTAYLQSHNLTPQQRQLLLAAQGAISPALFVGRRTDQQREEVAAHRAALEAALGPAARRYLYKDFGPALDLTAALPLGESALWSWRRSAETLPLTGPLHADDPYCNCNYASNDDCSYSQNCRSPFHCVEYDPWWGCGDADWCDRRCSYDPLE